MSERDRFQPTTEQMALASTVGDALGALLPLRRLHDGDFETAAVWGELRDLGLFSIVQAEIRGGAGLGVIEEALVALELGRRLASPAVIATLAAAPHTNAETMRTSVVAAAYVRDGRQILIKEPDADAVLLREAEGALLANYPATTASIDAEHWTAGLAAMESCAGARLDLDQFGMARLRLLDAAALAGVALTALDMAVAYAGVREQFGRPIGAFQAIKHHCANMALSARCAGDLVAFAAVALADQDADGLLLAESALVMAGNAALQNAGLNIQIHGGVGFSAEADPHLLIKRAHLYLAVAGGLDSAVERIDRLAGEPRHAVLMEQNG